MLSACCAVDKSDSVCAFRLGLVTIALVRANGLLCPPWLLYIEIPVREVLACVSSLATVFSPCVETADDSVGDAGNDVLCVVLVE